MAAQRGGGARPRRARRERRARRARLALDQREGKVAAENDAARRARPVGQACGDRADAGDRHDAERDAGDEHAEAAQPAAQLAPQAQRERQRRRRRCHACVRPLIGRRRRLSMPSRMHVQHAVAARGQRRVVGDQHQRACRARAWPRNSNSMISRPVVLVEIAGRLVGDEDRRIGRERAGERNALLLAAGQFGRIVVQPLAKADGGQFALGARKRVGAPASSSGTATFSSAVMVGIRWKDWNTMPIFLPRKRASASSSSLPQIFAGDDDRAGIGALESGHHHQQRRFARAGWTDAGRRPRRGLYSG